MNHKLTNQKINVAMQLLQEVGKELQEAAKELQDNDHVNRGLEDGRTIATIKSAVAVLETIFNKDTEKWQHGPSYKELLHHYHATKGLHCTDLPDRITEDQKDVFFQL